MSHVTVETLDRDLFGGEVTPRRRAMGSHQTNGTTTGGSDEWLTPPDLLRALGPFDLDVCAPAAERRPWATATRHFSIEDDGLRQPWEGRVWCNPPYTQSSKWLARLADHEHGMALIFARTETSTWHEQVWPRASGLLFLRGRLNFYDINGQRARQNAGAPSVLIAYGPADAAVLAEHPVPGHFVPLS